jgi:hypothetical protein
VWRTKDIPAKRDDVRFAQERWVRSKQRQAAYSDSINRKSDAIKYLEEAQNLARRWNIDGNRLSDYPDLPEHPDSISPDNTKIKIIRALAKLGYLRHDIAEQLHISERDVSAVLDGRMD